MSVEIGDARKLFGDDIATFSFNLLRQCEISGLQITTAESCTGGLIAGALTALPGSSAIVHGGFVTYANAAKVAMVGVPQATLDAHGAVSNQTAQAMAEGALTAADVDLAIAVTGIAGPGGGSAEKPVGLVHFGVARRDHETLLDAQRFGDLGRHEIRVATVRHALRLALKALHQD